jgi:hypothetical protein
MYLQDLGRRVPLTNSDLTIHQVSDQFVTSIAWLEIGFTLLIPIIVAF